MSSLRFPCCRYRCLRRHCFPGLECWTEQPICVQRRTFHLVRGVGVLGPSSFHAPLAQFLHLILGAGVPVGLLVPVAEPSACLSFLLCHREPASPAVGCHPWLSLLNAPCDQRLSDNSNSSPPCCTAPDSMSLPGSRNISSNRQLSRQTHPPTRCRCVWRCDSLRCLHVLYPHQGCAVRAGTLQYTTAQHDEV